MRRHLTVAACVRGASRNIATLSLARVQEAHRFRPAKQRAQPLPQVAQAKAKLRSFHAQRCDGSLHLLRDLGDRRPILRMLLEAPQVSGGPFTTGLLLVVRTFQLVSS